MNIETIDFDQPTKYGDTPLDLAIKYNQIGTVKALLDRGAPIEKSDNTGFGVSYSPLNLAVILSKIEIVKLLLKHKANANKVDSLGYTPLQNLFSKSRYNKADLEIANLLIEHGANTYVLTPDGKKLEDLVPINKKPELRAFLEQCYVKNLENKVEKKLSPKSRRKTFVSREEERRKANQDTAISRIK